MCLGLFLYPARTCLGFSKLSHSSFSGLSHSSVVTVFSGWASMLVVIYGTYRAHNERMKPVVSADCAYSHWKDGM